MKTVTRIGTVTEDEEKHHSLSYLYLEIAQTGLWL